MCMYYNEFDQFSQNFSLATALAANMAILTFSNFQEFCKRVGGKCFTLERALLHFALFNPFSVCDEIKYV